LLEVVKEHEAGTIDNGFGEICTAPGYPLPVETVLYKFLDMDNEAGFDVRSEGNIVVITH